MSNINNVDSFLEKLQSMTPGNKKKVFEKKRTIDKTFCSYPGAFGKYQILPISSSVSGFPFVTLPNTREINIPRKNIAADGTESVYNAWIRLLPKSAYTIKDPSTGREVSSLTAADEALMEQAYTVWEELYQEVDARNNAMDPTIGKLIRRKNYTIFFGNTLNYWANGDMRTPVRQNFNTLFVITAKGFLKTVEDAIQDTNITSGIGNNSWVEQIYNRELSNRKGFMMLSVNKADGPGFNISVNHQLGADNYLSGVSINAEDMELMHNPVETFLGWQANRDDDAKPEERRLFNKALYNEAIEYMTDQLTKIRIAKQNGTSIQDAIKATNDLLLANATPTNTRGQQTNDPILADMAQKANENQQQFGGYGNNNTIGSNMQDIAAKNTNPLQNPAAAHLDPVTGMPVNDSIGTTNNGGSTGFGGFGGGNSTPFNQPSFAGGFGGNNNPF